MRFPSYASPFSSLPIRILLSDRYMYGGTSRLDGAGLFLNTRAARSKVEPWHGHRKPPVQSSGSDGWAPSAKRDDGEQPRCEQIPTTTSTSLCSARDRVSFLA